MAWPTCAANLRQAEDDEQNPYDVGALPDGRLPPLHPDELSHSWNRSLAPEIGEENIAGAVSRMILLQFA